MNLSLEPQRLITSGALIVLYWLMCLVIRQKHQQKHSPSIDAHQATLQSNHDSDWLVAFASQTGFAEELARHTAATLRLAGLSVRLCTLANLTAHDLAQTHRILFVVSTYGEGDPPDNAAQFATHIMAKSVPLAHLHYAILAVGDNSYKHFCGFGKTLERWLNAQGAHCLFPRVDVNRCSAVAIESWQQQLSHLAGTSDAPDWSGPPFTEWRLRKRKLLNQGSVGESVYHLTFEPANHDLPTWESGDLVQVLAPSQAEQARDYSIASIPTERRIELLVRLHRHPDGTTGIASGWLTTGLALDGAVQMRVRQHQRFRLGDNAQRPLILIGNGTGIAGLRAHLKARTDKHITSNWLLFGERNQEHDFHFRQEIEQWQTSGQLQRLDLAFSRDQPDRIYVQDKLTAAADTVRDWIARDAAIYVCGSLQGMAGGVDAALATILGRQQLDELSTSGRYQRDVY